MVAVAKGLRIMYFLSRLRLSASAFQSDSCGLALLQTAAIHLVLSEAACSHDDGLILKSLSVFKSFPLAATGALSMLEFTKKFLGQSEVWNADYMASSAKLGFH